MAQYTYSEIISWTKNKTQFVDEYLSGIDIQKIKCIKFRGMLADEAHKIIKRLKDKKYTEKLTNLKMIVVGRNCQFSKKVAVDFCKLISAVPSITELIFNGWFEKTSHGADLYKGLLKIPFLKQISIGDGVELGTKEDIKLIQLSTAEISINHRRGQNMDTATEQFSSILRKSSTIRSLELLTGPVVANNSLFPAIGINTSLIRLFITLDAPGYDFSALKPLTLPETSNNLQDLEIDGRHYINGESMDTIYEIINNNTKLTTLSLRRINDIQKQLGQLLAKNTSLKSLTLADLDITQNLLEGFKLNTSLTDISIFSDTYLSICQSFVDAPNRSLKSLSLGLGVLYNSASNRIVESLTSLNQLLKNVTTLTKLELNGVAALNVDLLVEGLNSAHNNIRVLKIRSKALTNDMIVPLMCGLEQNSKIQQLDLSYNIIVGDEYRPIWNMLLKNKTIKSLKIPDMSREAGAGVNDQMFSELMQVLSINTTLLFLEIWPRDKDRAVELFVDTFVDKQSDLISLWSFTPLSENYDIELILRNNNRRYLDHIVLYHNLKRYNGTSLPLELWAQIFSHLIPV